MLNNNIPNIEIPNIDEITGLVKKGIAQADIASRLEELELWRKQIADPQIQENLANLNVMYTNIQTMYEDITTIYTKLKNSAEHLSNEVQAMEAPVQTTINNIGWLVTDYNEIRQDLSYWIPNIIGALIHTIEAVHHTVGMAKGIQSVFNGFKNRLFPALMNSLK